MLISRARRNPARDKGHTMFTMYGAPAGQNKAHRDDLMWFKAGKGAYLHVSGLYGIQKNQKNNRWYIVDAETGEVMEHPKYAPMSFSGFSLTDAKYEFEKNMTQG